MKQKDLPAPRELPVEMRKLMHLSWHLALTWKQRFQIAIGYNLDVKVKIACQHSPGQFHPLIEIKTTEELLPAKQGETSSE